MTCWGSNLDQQVRPAFSAVEGPFVGALNAETMGCGARFVCASDRGGVTCWGNAPSRADGGSTARADMIAGGDSHACALVDGGIECWGANDFGQAPGRVDLPGPGIEVSSRYAHTCAVSAGQAFCWGLGTSGQLGTGETPRQGAVASVPALLGVAHVCAGGAHSCGLRENGEVYCWGQNILGQLGDASRDDGLLPVGPVRYGGAFRELSCGEGSTCAITNEGTLVCWGDNSCGILSPDGGPSTDPISVADGVVHAALGDGVLCFTHKDGSWSCRGRNQLGQVRLPVSECATIRAAP